MHNSGPGFHIARIPVWNSAELNGSNFQGLSKRMHISCVGALQGFLFRPCGHV
jgi:hypothetical protein